jgi:hypothetical protein
VTFSLKVSEGALIGMFICAEVIPLAFILYTLFKELGVFDQLAACCKKKRYPSDTGATETKS